MADRRIRHRKRTNRIIALTVLLSLCLIVCGVIYLNGGFGKAQPASADYYDAVKPELTSQFKVWPSFNTLYLASGESQQVTARVQDENGEDVEPSLVLTTSDGAVASVDGDKIVAVANGECEISVAIADYPVNSSSIHVTVSDQELKGGFTYIDGILIVNKEFHLPSTYNPGLDAEARAAFDEMTAAAAEEGYTLFIQSGFRSYDLQTRLFAGNAARDGETAANRYSARAGESEHQSGLAMDICTASDWNFGATPTGKWLAEHAHEYGFILRFMQDKESVTGYKYEPWHFRYIGKDNAAKVYESGLTLEEYLGLPSAPQ